MDGWTIWVACYVIIAAFAVYMTLREWRAQDKSERASAMVGLSLCFFWPVMLGLVFVSALRDLGEEEVY